MTRVFKLCGGEHSPLYKDYTSLVEFRLTLCLGQESHTSERTVARSEWSPWWTTVVRPEVWLPVNDCRYVSLRLVSSVLVIQSLGYRGEGCIVNGR